MGGGGRRWLRWTVGDRSRGSEEDSRGRDIDRKEKKRKEKERKGRNAQGKKGKDDVDYASRFRTMKEL